MYAMYHSLCKTDTRPSLVPYTRDTLLSAITRRDAVTGSWQQPHRHTTHCDVTVAAVTDNFMTLLIDTRRRGGGAFTATQCTDILALVP